MVYKSERAEDWGRTENPAGQLLPNQLPPEDGAASVKNWRVSRTNDVIIKKHKSEWQPSSKETEWSRLSIEEARSRKWDMKERPWGLTHMAKFRWPSTKSSWRFAIEVRDRIDQVISWMCWTLSWVSETSISQLSSVKSRKSKLVAGPRVSFSEREIPNCWN